MIANLTKLRLREWEMGCCCERFMKSWSHQFYLQWRFLTLSCEAYASDCPMYQSAFSFLAWWEFFCNGKCITEIKKRIATAKDAFQKLSLILKNRNISMTTKFRILKTYVWSTLTYGCECWTITSDIEKKIEAAEMWFIRRMLRISWAEKKTNVNVLREGNVQRSLLKTIRKRQMEFLGHVCRRRGLEFLSLTGKVEGKRDRGKQRITFLDSLCNSATGGQSKGLNFLKLSDDRDVWRGMVANVCSRSGTWWWWEFFKYPKYAANQPEKDDWAWY